MQYSMSDFYEQIVEGDINGDGLFSHQDLFMSISHILGTVVLDEEIYMNFDFDHNLTVDIFDVSLASDLLTSPW